MVRRPGRTLAGLAIAGVMVLAPSAHAQDAAANVTETQCAGVATWVKTAEGQSGGRYYGDFKISFPSPTAACSWYYAGAGTEGGVGHGGEPVSSGPYTMYLHCTSTLSGNWQVPYVCYETYSLAGYMEWATGATTLFDVETDFWNGAVDITFGNRLLPTGSGSIFPGSRWTTTFVLTSDYVRAITY